MATTTFDYNRDNLFTPVIFREDFGTATLSATQAWSLFFTAGQEENLFGVNGEVGWFYNHLLTAGVITFGLGAVLSSGAVSPFFF